MKLGIRSSKNEHKVKGRQYTTLMFITDATKQAKSIRIPKWIRFPMLIVAVLLVLGSLSLYQYVVGLEAVVVNSNLMTQEAYIDSESKDLTIHTLEEELNTIKETRYDQLVQLQTQAVELGMRLSELEDYRNEMQEFKNEIDINLSTSEETEAKENNVSEEKDNGSFEDSNDFFDGASLEMDPNMFAGNSYLRKETLKLQVNPIGFDLTLSTNAMRDYRLGENQGEPANISSLDLDSVDFDQEISKLNVYLDMAIGEIDSGEDEFAETTEALGDIIPYVEAYPSILPIENTYITSYFGYRKNPFGGYSSEFHSGVDLKARYEPIKATGAGVVVESKYLSGYGYTVIIDHGYGIMTKYAHNSKLYVSVGDEVVRGDVITKSGNTGRSTGPHLHYEILIDGEPQNPLDFIYEEKYKNEN